jgi:alpha-L-rhamnosidase
MSADKLTRRHFLSNASTIAATAATAGLPVLSARAEEVSLRQTPLSITAKERLLDLAPAKWIWYPAQRTLANTFFHFRKTVEVRKAIKAATGWILGDSRYILFCNGNRIQFGPAPNDPRYSEADPMDLTNHLTGKSNTIGATVLYYGFGDGTWPAGKPGFIFKLQIQYADGSEDVIVSDESWKVKLADSWQPGMYKRWYLRSLQESFDNRKYPHGWNSAGYQPDDTWRTVALINGAANATSLTTSVRDYLYDCGSPEVSELRKRSIPLIKEQRIPAARFVEGHWLRWRVSPYEYFDLVTSDAFASEPGPVIQSIGTDCLLTLTDNRKTAVVTYEMTEQVVGWPYFSIEAPENTVIELMVQQGHVPHNSGGPALINSNFHSWTRFICKEGKNDFITFDYESVKWIQLHIHGATGNIRVTAPGVLRRVYPFPEVPRINTSDPALQKLFNASFNTILNNSQDTIVDCMGRERQQYSGDIGHVVHMLHRAYNEVLLPSRFVNTFSQGITLDGYFMDSWPAYDRLNRISQRQLGLTPWGPLLDHGVGFNYDVWYHYLYSGNRDDIEEVFPRLVKFYNYLRKLTLKDGLLPVENIGTPAVWMDTDSYKLQRHKQCAFNLYVAGMLKDAFSRVCMAFNENELAASAVEWSRAIVKAVRNKFWSSAHQMLIVNLPWIKKEKEPRTCERSIAHFILSGFATRNESSLLMKELLSNPARLGKCYPPNAQWRYWALAANGEMNSILTEFRNRWINMPAVQQNNTLPETWVTIPDEHAQYSHAAIAPIYVAYMSIAGIAALEPGYSKVRIRPLPGDLESFSISNFTPRGPIDLGWSGNQGNRSMQIQLPNGCDGELWLNEKESTDLPVIRKAEGIQVLQLPAGKLWNGVLKYT